MRVIEQFIRHPVESLSLDLPFPPSVNRLWRSARGKVFRSDRYRIWMQAAGNQLKAQRPGRIKGDFTIHIILGRPDRRLRDSDNYAKAILDLLQAHGVIENDHGQVDTRITWSDTIDGAHVVLARAVRRAA